MGIIVDITIFSINLLIYLFYTLIFIVVLSVVLFCIRYLYQKVNGIL